MFRRMCRLPVLSLQPRVAGSFLRALKVSATELRVGHVLTGESVPGQTADKILAVEDFTKGKAGKGGGYVQVKLRDYVSGQSVLTHKFRSADRVDLIELEAEKSFIFLYEEGDLLHLMHGETGEQIELPIELLGEGRAAWLQDGMELRVRNYQGRPLTAQLPEQVTLEVTEASASARVGKSGDHHKTVTLENGFKLRAPHFIEAGQHVLVNTSDGAYAGRVDS
jgi:elongation factor P